MVLESSDYNGIQSIAHHLCDTTRFKVTPECILSLMNPGSFNDKERKVSELKWNQKFSAKGTTSLNSFTAHDTSQR